MVATTAGLRDNAVGGRAVWALVLLGTLAVCTCFYPGYLDGDTNWQHQQGVSGQYSDMHPVVMSWMIGRLDAVIEGTGGYFLLTTLIFWAGLGITLRAFTSSRRNFVMAALIIGTSAPTLSMLSHIQKDLGMVVGLLGAFALLVEADRRRNLTLLLCTLPLLFYALAVRHDGVTAVVPMSLRFGWLLTRDHLSSRMAQRLAAPWRRLFVGVLVLAMLYLMSVLATRAILGKEGQRFHIEQVLMAYDMVGISVRTGQSVVSDLYFPKKPFAMQELEAMYRAESAYYLIWAQPKWRKIPLTRAPILLDKIRDTWLRAIAEEPVAYLAHRACLFVALIGFGEHMPYRHFGLPRGRTFEYRGPTVFQFPHARALISFFEWAGPTPLLRAWPYLIAGAAGLAMAWRRPNRHRLEVTLLAASSAFYIAPLLLIAVASEFRYMWWPALSAMLQLVLALEGRGTTINDDVEGVDGVDNDINDVINNNAGSRVTDHAVTTSQI